MIATVVAVFTLQKEPKSMSKRGERVESGVRGVWHVSVDVTSTVLAQLERYACWFVGNLKNRYCLCGLRLLLIFLRKTNIAP